MVITPWTKPAELTITPYPFQLMMAAAAAQKQQYDEGEALQGTIEDDLAKIKSIEIDTPLRDQELKNYQDKINRLVEKYKGDYGAMAAEFKQIQRDYNYNKNYGIIGAINNRYESRVKSVEEKNKAVDAWIKGENGGMSREDAQLAQAYEDAHQAPLTKDPKLGTFTGYYTENPTRTIKIQQKALALAKEMKPEVIALHNGLRDVGNGYYEAADGTLTILTPEHIINTVSAALKQDPEVANYVNWKYRVNNGDELISNYIGTQTPEGYLGKDMQGNEVMRNPATAPKEAAALKEQLLTSDINNAAIIAANTYKQNEKNLNYSYHANKLWEMQQEEARKKREAEMYSFEGEGQGVGVDNSLGFTEDDFSTIPAKPETKAVPASDSPNFLGVDEFGVAERYETSVYPKGTTTTTKTNPNTFTGTRKENFTKLLYTLANENPNDAHVSDILNKYVNGIQLTPQEVKDVYPHIQKIVTRTKNSPIKNNTKNVPLVNIVDPNERSAVNQQLGGSKDETLTVAQLGGANSVNVEWFDPSENKKVSVQDVKTEHALTPNALVTIQMKVNGSNPISAATGNKNFADGYQVAINGKTYYIEGPKWSSGPLRVEKSIKVNDATVGDASYEPDVIQHTTFNDIPYNFKYTSSSQNPNQGVYRVTRLGTPSIENQSKKSKEAAAAWGTAILNAEFTSASEVTQALSQYYILLNKK